DAAKDDRAIPVPVLLKDDGTHCLFGVLDWVVDEEEVSGSACQSTADATADHAASLISNGPGGLGHRVFFDVDAQWWSPALDNVLDLGAKASGHCLFITGKEDSGVWPEEKVPGREVVAGEPALAVLIRKVDNKALGPSGSQLNEFLVHEGNVLGHLELALGVGLGEVSRGEQMGALLHELFKVVHSPSLTAPTCEVHRGGLRGGA